MFYGPDGSWSPAWNTGLCFHHLRFVSENHFLQINGNDITKLSNHGAVSLIKAQPHRVEIAVLRPKGSSAPPKPARGDDIAKLLQGLGTESETEAPVASTPKSVRKSPEQQVRTLLSCMDNVLIFNQCYNFIFYNNIIIIMYFVIIISMYMWGILLSSPFELHDVGSRFSGHAFRVLHVGDCISPQRCPFGCQRWLYWDLTLWIVAHNICILLPTPCASIATVLHCA